MNSGTWNIRQSPNTASKIITVVNGGMIYNYSTTMNGWAYIPVLKGWIGSKGYKIKK